MRFVSWNVNGIRACLDKGFLDFFNKIDADIFAIQETKMQEGQKDINIEGYKYYMNSAIKKGYSGTLIYTRLNPINVYYGLTDGLYNDEGRIITLEFVDFYFITIYTPNSQNELKRLPYRLTFEENLRKYLVSLNKPIILCGDFNVAHKEIDIRNPKTNIHNAGFTIEERNEFSKLLDLGFVDTFRYLHPELIKYSWWSYKTKAREKGIGWRIDYFVISDTIKENLMKSDICCDVLGSDHAPIYIDIDLKEGE